MYMNKTIESNTKAYRLAKQITEDIQNGKFSSGVLLPPDGELATEYDVSRITMRKSLAILSEKGRIRRLPHGGALAMNVESPPNTVGSDLKSASTTAQAARKLTLGMINACGSNFSIIHRLAGARRYAEENNLKITHFLLPSHEESLDILSRVEEYELDGVITSPYFDDRYIKVFKNLIEKKFPIVLQNKLDVLPMISSVMSCDETGAYQATHYLIDKYRRPVYYLCSPTETEITQERHQGYINAMKDAGMEEFIDSHTFRMDIHANDPTYWSSEKNWLPGFYAAEKLLSKIELPASIFCENDFDARGFYEAAKERNLTIGKDIYVVGFGDFPLAKLIKPGMTSCHADAEELGYEEGRLLHRLIKKEVHAPIHIRLPMYLTIRESA